MDQSFIGLLLSIDNKVLNRELSKDENAKLGGFTIHELVHCEQASLIAKYKAEQGGNSRLQDPLSSEISDPAKKWLDNGGHLSLEQKDRAALIIRDYTKSGLSQREFIGKKLFSAELDLALQERDYQQVLRFAPEGSDDFQRLNQLKPLRDDAEKKRDAALEKYKNIAVESEAYTVQDAYIKYQKANVNQSRFILQKSAVKNSKSSENLESFDSINTVSQREVASALEQEYIEIIDAYTDKNGKVDLAMLKKDLKDNNADQETIHGVIALITPEMQRQSIRETQLQM